MLRKIVTTSLCVLLLAAGAAPMLWSGPAPARSVARAAVDKEFAVKFCYSQYRNQSDISRCLVANLPS
jgi:hypothetical protein